MEKLKKLSRRLQNLPLSFDPPKSVVSELTEKLLALETGKVDESKFSKKERKKLAKDEAALEKKKNKYAKKLGITIQGKPIRAQSKFTLDAGSLAILLLILFIGAMVYYFGFHHPSTEPWKVKSINGSYLINGSSTVSSNLYTDQTIGTQAESNLEITIAGQANLVFGENSEFVIVNAREGNNSVDLKKGSLEFKTLSIFPNFILIHNSLKIYDKQSEFQYTLLPNGDSEIFVKDGFIKIEVPGDEIYISNDYSCVIKGSSTINIPIRKDASSKLKGNLEYLSTNIQDVGVISGVLLEAGEYDALSLHRLLEIVSPSNRELVYQKLANLFPPPPNTTKAGILNLDKTMLEDWWYSIEWQF